MRIRTIKPEFWTHPVISRLDDSAKLLALGLLNYADDEGLFLADPRLVRAALRPLDEDSEFTRHTLATLEKIEWIRVVNHDTHGAIGCVVNFCKHQRIDHPYPSKLRAYIRGLLPDCSRNVRRKVRERSLNVPEKPSEEQGTGNRKGNEGKGAGKSLAPVGASESDSTSGQEPVKKPRARNHLIDTLVAIDGSDPAKTTESAFKAAAKALSEIRAVTPDVNPAEIIRRADNYRRHFNVPISHNALAKHWARCDKAPAQVALPLAHRAAKAAREFPEPPIQVPDL
jgi:hypothetical protein